MILFIKLKNFSKLKDRQSRQGILRLENQCHSPGTPKSHLFLKCILTKVDLPAFHSLLFPEPLTHKCEISLESIQWDSSAQVPLEVTLMLVKWVIPWGRLGESTLQVSQLDW